MENNGSNKKSDNTYLVGYVIIGIAAILVGQNQLMLGAILGVVGFVVMLKLTGHM